MNPAAPSAGQLTASRAAHWHQAENPLLSIEDVRKWLQASGLVLYTPKPQLGAPAPTFVEATLGKPNVEPALADLDAAKSLLQRLVAEGSAVPLNLLGATGGAGTDQPDFIVSAAVFSYIFTLRGNKAWKQSPVTAGPVKVSPLALATYELLSAKVTMSAYDLTTQLGKEVTETAVLRSLTELWSQLRVLPVPQPDGSATMWELATGRFTKQIKAGANAGQPSALSALISLYLAQAVVATEDEIESFLSPLAARSRVRDVIHALLSARQLETLVIDGKTLLHVGGDLPAFAAVASAEPAATADVQTEEGGPRIKKFAAKPGSKIGTGLRAKPAYGARPSFGSRAGSGSSRPSFGGGDRERRPFKRDDRPGGARPSRPAGSDRPARPSFDKPWQENRPSRAAGEGSGEFKPRSPRPPYAGRSDAGAGRPPRREFTPRDGEAPKRTFSKPGTFGRKREGGDRPAFGGADSRPPRRDFAASGERSDRPARPAAGGFKRPGSYSPRPSSSFNGPRPEGGGKPPFARGPERGEGGEAPRKVFRKFDAPRGPKPFGSKPSFGAKPFGDRPPRTFDGPRPERSGGSDRPRGEGRPSFGAKPGGFGPKKPYSNSGPRSGPGAAARSGPRSGSKPGGFAGKGGPFAKFADGAKPFRKPGAPKKPAGGFTPTRRKRDEDEK